LVEDFSSKVVFYYYWSNLAETVEEGDLGAIEVNKEYFWVVIYLVDKAVVVGLCQ